MENTNTFDLHHLLPEDVLIQILVLLPVISLLRFKSVCKSWRALIQSSFFIDLHLNKNNNTSSSNFGTFIFQTGQQGGVYDFYEKKYEAFMLSSGGGGSGDEKLKWEGLGFPPCYHVHKESPGKRTLMVGSCNGLICIHDTTRREVSLWNPATRQFRLLLPKSSSSSLTTLLLAAGSINGDLEEDFAAFGYDVKTKDYKVVQISWSRPYYCMNDNSWIPIEEYIFRVQVYTSSTDSWRLLEGINSFPGLPYQGLGENHGVYLNGSYYFQTGYAGCKMILSFDFTKEIFTTIQLHEYHHLSNTILTTYLGEKLAVFARVIDQLNQYDIWVLNEHGGGSGNSNSNSFKEEESWTKIHSIQLNDSCTNGTPRGISNDGEFAFIATSRSIRINNGETVTICSLQLINLVTKEVVKEEFRSDHKVIRADVYKQSLVSICGN